VQTLSRGLELRTRRQAAVAANVANADTPGYRALDVSFAGAFEAAAGRLALTTTHGSHLSGLRSAGSDSLVLSGGTPRRDGNDVNIDSEMVKLAQNQIEYQFLARAANGKFRKLKEAISGRTSG
jgi:flagellar basal-body rod protein FlgB